jgi:peptide/nickel transport system permease protein
VLRYVLRRLLWVVFLLFAVSIVTFVLFFMMPGDPAAASVPRQATPEVIEQVRERMGLNQPLWKQYRDFLHGPDRIGVGRPSGILNWPPNLGYSFKNQEPVLNIILDRLPVTISLAIGSAVLWLLMGIPLGIMAALKPGSFRDRAATTFALFGASAPVFLVGVTLLYFLYFKLRIFPAPKYTPFIENPLLWAQGLFLAWLTVAIGLAALYTRLTRGSMLEIQGEDFVRTARAKGLVERRVVGRHILRPTLTPIVTILGLDLGALIGGAIVTEVLFGLPGIAQATVKALIDLDLPMIVGVVLTSSFFVVMFNLIVDILYAALDPRVRYS